MDRKSLIGFGIIAVILTAWMTYSNSQTQKEAELKKKYNDSVAKVDAARKAEEDKKAARIADSLKKIVVTADTTLNLDSLKKVQELQRWGMFSASAEGKNEPVIIENERMRVSIYPKGGRVGSVELKDYQTYKQKEEKSKDHLKLFTNDSTKFGLSFFDINRRRVTTDSLFFQPVAAGNISVSGKESKSVAFRLYADGSKDTYIEYNYTIAGNSDLLGCTVNIVNAGKMIGADQKDVMLTWGMNTPSQEKNIKNQRQVSTLYYQLDGDKDIEELSMAEDETESPTGDLKWVAFKQQYFTSVLIADTKFSTGPVFGIRTPSDPDAVKAMAVETPIPVSQNGNVAFPMKFYFGTTKYKVLKSYDLGLEKQIDLGFSLFGWLNKFAIMPIFSWLSGMFGSYGIIILLLTIIVKLVLFPIAYKSFLSSAKMRVLKPEIDVINEKFKDGDPMKKQQETMALYRKAGVNPMAGCIPLLLQLPILFALLRFFPTVFELRQSSFLWAEDLSTYDSILNLGVDVPFYGDHVSLFAILMTASTLLYTWMNQQMLSTGNQLPGMKWLMYLMPVMFLGFLNSASAALSYYYFLSNMITFLQMFLMRRFVDEGAIREKIEANKKKPVKKSGLMQRLEAAQRRQLEQGKNNGKKK
jgi:YidC/Oxa1 family membrane protein insertase